MGEFFIVRAALMITFVVSFFLTIRRISKDICRKLIGQIVLHGPYQKQQSKTATFGTKVYQKQAK